MASNLAPVILFVYNRPLHTKRTIENLQKNLFAENTELFIYSDEAKSKNDVLEVQKVRQYIKTISGFRKITIVERQQNFGLSKNIINGVTDVISSYGKAIILEDDLLTSPYFLKYMNKALDFYKNKEEIMSISAYNHPPSIMKIPADYNEQIYFNYRNSSWGWGTWKNRWDMVDWNVEDFNEFKKDKFAQKKFNRGGEDLSDMLIAQMEGKIDSWAIRFTYAHFKYDKLSVCPCHSYVQNIGHDGSGQHCGKSKRYQNDLTKAPEKIKFPEEIKVNQCIMDEFSQIYKNNVLKKLKHIFINKLCLLHNIW
ncbi:glycosyltransferase [Methanohalophilus mahii]|uniref:Uncharacterized protein n=1 Tax=Methanohalophilus mahii (strain ATCC 35705 / DSM 5219 / SLP) TaxID=547558 RepID=D5E8W4_METMS|nr:glycosyltransferase [Methanohalophilus mahii]ADE35623.1 conserved hypothetical protein [Methanohalophilus mahii DSM 5219]